MKDEPPLKKIICAIAILIFLPLSVYAPWDKYVEESPVLIQENSLIAQGSNQIHPQVLSTLYSGASGEELFEGLKYPTIIKCLAQKESLMGLKRSGDKGQSRGLLHYYRWWEEDSLWGAKCVGEYGFTDIDNDRQQVLCADLLLQEDYNYVWKWYYSAKKCLK